MGGRQLVSFLVLLAWVGLVSAEDAKKPLAPKNATKVKMLPLFEEEEETPALDLPTTATPPSKGITHQAAACPICQPSCPDCCFNHEEKTNLGVGWLTIEYLLWWTKDDKIPPLVTGNQNPTGLNPILGQPGTNVILGPEISFQGNSGFRLTAGVCLDPEEQVGFELSRFGLQRERHNFAATSNQYANLGYAYLDENNQEQAFAAGQIGNFQGGVSALSRCVLWSAEGNMVRGWNRNPGNFRFQTLMGIRYLDLEETLDLYLVRSALPGSHVSFRGTSYNAPAGNFTADAFRTRNQFWGGQVGARGEYRLGELILSFQGKIALGCNQELVNIMGASFLLQPGVNPQPTPGGFFAQTSNSGRDSNEVFTVIPEVSAAIGYQVTPVFHVSLGYNLLYWVEAVRPGQQIDRVVDTRQVPVAGNFNPLATPTSPRPLFENDSFWVQGMTIGFNFKY